MIFLVISTPHPSRPEEIKESRLKFIDWIKSLKTRNKIINFYPRVGRGAVVIFNVETNDELHELMTEWNNIIPVNMDIYPLVNPDNAAKTLKTQNKLKGKAS